MIINHSIKNLLFAACAGAVIFYGVNYVVANNSGNDKTQLLENKIRALEASLLKKETEIKNLRLLALRQQGRTDLTSVNSVAEICQQEKNNQGEQYQPVAYDGATVDAPSSTQVLKDLGTVSANDPRSFSEKANDLLSNEPTKEKVAIVSKGIFDMANDRENLPDYTLQSMYNAQSDPDLKRVIAQVLSSRGNNSLIDSQINEAEPRLKSENPVERQSAITSLAKTHSSSAANAIAPLLHDQNIDVKLDALLALRATGNQTHISLVENLLDDPDPAVSSLANDVVNNLRNLSDSARTMIASADIAAELPLMENP